MRTKYNNILKIFFKKLKYFNYSDNTIQIYCHYIEKFLSTTNKYPQHLTGADFQMYLNKFNFSSVSQQNQIISSLKFFYEKVLNKKYNKINFTRPRKENKLPQVIDKYELISKILSIKNKKHKAILALAYSTGMRVSEVINLKIKDIDSKRMLILIHNGKGKKDRYVPLSNKLLIILREYYIKYKPDIYLFNGQFSNQYSATSCNKIVKKHISNNAYFHLLRHSSFTALLESGVDLSIIQKIAGHKNISTTQIYTHISSQLLNSVITPI